MIYVWDNGGSCSDHTIWFIESAAPKQAVLALFDAYAAWGKSACYESRNSKCLGAGIEWFDGNVASMAQWIRDHVDYAYPTFDEERSAYRTLLDAAERVTC